MLISSPDEIFRIILSYHLHLKEGQPLRNMALRTGEAHHASLFWPKSTAQNKQAASSQTRGTDSFPLSRGLRGMNAGESPTLPKKGNSVTQLP